MAPKESTHQLDVRDVSKSFGGVRANDKISIRVGRGEIVGLIGPNGSGKTTLFNSIVGQHRIDSGSVHFEGEDITHLRVQKIARLGILRTFQHTRTYHGMTCLENIQISLPNRHLRMRQLALPLPADSNQRAHALLEFAGLLEQRHTLAGQLSFGQQRLLELAMVVMNEPRLVLLDEPTAGVNPTAINDVVERLRHVCRETGTTLVVIEHNIAVIMDLADRIYCLNHGHVLAEGPPELIKKDQRVIDAYLGAR